MPRSPPAILIDLSSQPTCSSHICRSSPYVPMHCKSQLQNATHGCRRSRGHQTHVPLLGISIDALAALVFCHYHVFPDPVLRDTKEPELRSGGGPNLTAIPSTHICPCFANCLHASAPLKAARVALYVYVQACTLNFTCVDPGLLDCEPPNLDVSDDSNELPVMLLTMGYIY